MTLLNKNGLFLVSICLFPLTLISAYDTVDVTQTVSGFPCRNGEKCTNEGYGFHTRVALWHSDPELLEIVMLVMGHLLRQWNIFV